ncbi:Uncharacterized protein FKW44_000836, partial [Caligus rogercresseyi]
SQSSSLRYLALSISNTPSNLNDTLRMAKIEKKWVVIDGLAPLDALLGKCIIPTISQDFRLFVLGNHSTPLHSNRILSDWKIICTQPPSLTKDPLLHTTFLKNRLSLWKEGIYGMELFSQVFEWSQTKKNDYKCNLQRLKVLIEKFDTPKVMRQLDLKEFCAFFGEVFEESMDEQTLE